jgi:type IV pilus assembly protein PilA
MLLGLDSPRTATTRTLRSRGTSNGRQVSLRTHASAGFTLVETMIVVLIVGILATLGTYGVRKYLLSAKTAEAVSMITQIRAAEEAYRDEMFVYLGLSGFDSWHPVDSPGAMVYDWHRETDVFDRVLGPLGVEPTGPVQFSYSVVAGIAGDSLPDNPGAQSFPEQAPDAPFYVIMAKADLNGDGHFAYAVAFSETSSVSIDQGF